MSGIDRELITLGHQIGRRGLTWGAAGNVSARSDADHLIITATGTRLGELTLDDLVTCRIASGGEEPVPKPSVEVEMHRAVYRARPDVRFVAHASPFYTTMLAATDLEPNPNLTTDTAFYLGSVRSVPYCPPGSRELASAAARCAAGADDLILRNHGCLILGGSAADVLTRVEALEILSHMTILGALGLSLTPLSSQEADDLRAALGEHGTA
ncbi:MAG: class II aldolase/adducin family protein [Chloroflexota bacterium]